MNKQELIDAVIEKNPKDFASHAAAERAVTNVFDIIAEQVASGNDVVLTGFGSFKSVKRAARVGRNPKTGAALQIDATIVPKFKAGTKFKAAVK